MLRARGLTRRFDGRDVFAGIDVDVAPGERLFLGGGNGAGKTTLLRCLAGTLSLHAGTVSLDGFATGSADFRARLGVGLNPEQAFYLRLSGHENLLVAARLRLPRRQVGPAVDAVEHELGITGFGRDRMAKYSSGMRARVAVARALLGAPRLLLLDEPTRSLDHDARVRLWAALDRRSVACIMASHRDSDRDRCHRVMHLPATAPVTGPPTTSVAPGLTAPALTAARP